ncbi:MAG TPA: hypothetical protein VFW74_15485 [Acidimicrobiia bacterium]|nr:hypothetical protein [Acidimicrobiia bacterium]
MPVTPPRGTTARRSDTKPLVIAAVAFVAAGLVVAAIIVAVTRGAATPKTYAPFPAGQAASLKATLNDGGPFFYPDPLKGKRNLLFALEDGHVVALADHPWQRAGCSVRWRGSINRFEDCDGNRYVSTDLPRYKTSIGDHGSAKGAFLVDLRTLLPPPGLQQAPPSSAATATS